MCIASSARARNGKPAKCPRYEKDSPRRIEHGSKLLPACVPARPLGDMIPGWQEREGQGHGGHFHGTTKVRPRKTRTGECSRERKKRYIAASVNF